MTPLTPRVALQVVSEVLTSFASAKGLLWRSPASSGKGLAENDAFVEKRTEAYRELYKVTLAVASDVLAIKGLEPRTPLGFVRQVNIYYMLAMRVTIRAFFADVAAMRDAAADVALYGNAADAGDILAAVDDLIKAKGGGAALERFSGALVAFREHARAKMGIQPAPATQPAIDAKDVPR